MSEESSDDLTRLRVEGTALERGVLEAACEDQPEGAARRLIIEQVVAEHRAPRRLPRWLGIGGAALAAAAGVALLHGRASPPLAVSPESSPSEPPSALTPQPSPSALSPFAPCAPAAVADGHTPLIDDFEDGDTRMAMVEHRAGTWLTFNDGTGAQFPKPGLLSAATRIPGGRGESHFGLHSSGGKFHKWGANLSLELNPRRCYDASAYAGIEFWARGRGELRLVVQMTQVVSEEFGGSCTEQCFDAHAKNIKLSRDFEHVVVRWEELRQAGFGPPLPFDARSLFSVAFSVLPEQTPFDFWIDDVSFVQR
jgi:hypothetical protein